MWTIFCDGACSGNPGPGGWGVIVSGFAVQRALSWTQELGGYSAGTTNNRMELQGAIEGLRLIQDEEGETTVYTDSVYVIRGITQWIFGWKSKGWKTAQGTPVLNEELWKTLDALVNERRNRKGVQVRFRYVPGHKGVPANERVDQIAVSFSKHEPVVLFRGESSSYSVDLESSIQASFEKLPERQSSASATSKTTKAQGYLSLIGSAPEHHHSWSNCEARVKGRPGARYRKYTTLAEAKEILSSWGVSAELINRLISR